MPQKYETAYPYDPNATPWNEADGIPWSEDTTGDLIRGLEHGESVEKIAMFLQYSEKTVRAKMRELGLKERPRHVHRRA